LDLIPKPIYDAEVTRSLELEKEIIDLQNEVDDLTSQVQSLTADSASLYISNDNLLITNAKLENSLTSVQQSQLELRQNLTTSLTKAINEATERTALEAENNGLTAQKNALVKQIDTLNNLLAQANASLQVAQEQLSAKTQAMAAGGVSTGQLATILWEKGDPSKNGAVEGLVYDWDLNAGGQKVWRPAGNSKAWSSKYVDVIVGPKDVDVELKQTFFLVPNKFSLKANSTQRFTFDKPNIYAVPSPANGKLKNAALAASAIAAATTAYIAIGGVAAASAGAALAVAGVTTALSSTAGAIAALGGPVGVAAAALLIVGSLIYAGTRPKYKDYTETITFVIKDKDANGKTEDKTFTGKVHSYDK